MELAIFRTGPCLSGDQNLQQDQFREHTTCVVTQDLAPRRAPCLV